MAAIEKQNGTIGNVLKQLRERKKLSMANVASALGVSLSAYQKYENNSRDVSTSLLNAFADFYGVTTDYLLGREQKGVQLIPLAAPVDDDKFIEIYSQLPEYAKQIFIDTMIKLSEAGKRNEEDLAELLLPLSECAASAGRGNWIDEEYTVRVKVRSTEQSRRANIVIPVSGDSMEPLYSDGDKVLVKIQPDIEPGEVGIFIVDGEGFIKKKGSGELISINPEYDNIPIKESTDYRCFGKVLGKAEIVE